MAKGKTAQDAFDATIEVVKQTTRGRRKTYRPYTTTNKTFRIRDYLEQPLAKEAFFSGKTQSEVICLALEQYLKVEREF